MEIRKKLKSLLQNNKISSTEYRYLVCTESLQFLTTDKNFEIFEHLGEGSYGKVYAANSPDYNTVVAVKIVCPEDVWVGELALWPTLEHQNVLPLLDAITMPYACLFVTPVLFNDMETMLEDEDFYNNPLALTITKTWLTGILDALDYLHTRNLCHLDIKADNILIDHNFKAVLCDFSFINHADTSTERYGVPLPYRPPETCLAFEEDITVDAVPFEMWSYGILALNVLTGHFLKNRLPLEVKYWHKDIYPLLFEAMQLTTFRIYMAKAFPLSNTDEVFTNAFNFVQYILRLQPKERPSVRMTYQHVFLKERGHMLEKPDNIWLFYDMSTCFCKCIKPVECIRERKDLYDRFKLRKSFKRPFAGYKKRRLWEKPSKCTKIDEKPVSNNSPCIEVRCISETSLKHKKENLQKSIFVESAPLNNTLDLVATSHDSNSVAKRKSNGKCQSFAKGDSTKSEHDAFSLENLNVCRVKDAEEMLSKCVAPTTIEAVLKSPEERRISVLQDKTKRKDVINDGNAIVANHLAIRNFENYEDYKEDFFISTRTDEKTSLENFTYSLIQNDNPLDSNLTEKKENSILSQIFAVTEESIALDQNDSSNSGMIQANSVNSSRTYTIEDSLSERSKSKEIDDVSTREIILPLVQNESTPAAIVTVIRRKQKKKIRICEWFTEKFNALYLRISKRKTDKFRNGKPENI